MEAHMSALWGRKAAQMAILILLVSSAAALARAGDLNGTWLFAVKIGGQTGSPTVSFKVDGEKLTGHDSSTVLGEHDFTGEVKGRAFTFKFTADQIGEVAYAGTLQDDDTLKGTVTAGGVGEGTFTGTRKS